jgi:signal transduction histidine kinase
MIVGEEPLSRRVRTDVECRSYAPPRGSGAHSGMFAALSQDDKRLLRQLIAIGTAAAVALIAVGSYAEPAILGGLLVLTGVTSWAVLHRSARERRQLIERFEQAHHRAEGLTQQVDAMLDDLATAEEEKMRRVVALADGISHELRNPLAILSMGLDALGACHCHPPADGSEVPIAAMRDALLRVEGFAHHLTAVSIENRRIDADVDLNETIRSLASLIPLNLCTSDATISLDLSPSVAALSLPHESVALSLFIILSAAAEHVHEPRGSLEIETRMQPGEDGVQIRIATSDLASQEAPPSSLDTSSSGWKDSALDTAARIIGSLGGRMRLYPQTSGAEICTLTLPRAFGPRE